MAQERGVDYRLSVRVESIGLVDHRVRALVNNGNGPGGVDARLAILCNGFGSSLPRRMGLGQVGDFVLGAQVEVEIKEADEVEVYLGHDIAPGFFAWLVPTFPGRGLAGLLSRRSPGLFMKEFLARLVREGKIESANVEVAYGGIPLRPLPRTYGDRVVAIGDAAGHVKPTTGGGIYYGLLSADIAANTIHEAICAGDLTAGRLKRYERGWKKVLGRDLQIGYWSRRLYESMSNKRIDRLFDVFEADGVHEALLQSPGFSFDWHGDSILRALRHKAVRQTIWSATKSALPR
jgi:flavin-dependent dehydrogenase